MRCYTLCLTFLLTIAFPAHGAPSFSNNHNIGKVQNKILSNPGSPDAELALLGIFGMWDKVPPATVTTALRRVSELSTAPVRLRERARELLAQAMIRVGDLKGADASYAERGFLHDWVVAGPFDNEGGTGFETPSPPEELLTDSADTKAPLPGKTDDVFYRAIPKESTAFGYNHLESLLDPCTNTCFYAVTTLRSSRAGSGILRIGAGGSFTAFWNGRKALTDSVYRRPNPDRVAAGIKIRKGPNRLLIKVCTEDGGDLGFFARVVDNKAEPWPFETVTNQLSELKIPVVKGAATKPIPQTMESLLEAASKSRASAKSLANAARFLVTTGSDDRSTHLARDLARAACKKSPGVDNCLLWADAATNRNEQSKAIAHATMADPDSKTVLLAHARFERDGPLPVRALPDIDAILSGDKEHLEAAALEIDILAARGFPGTALARLDKLLEQHSKTPFLIKQALDHATSVGNGSRALALTTNMLDYHFEDIEYHQILARAALARTDKSALKYHLNTLERLRPYDKENRIFISRLLEGTGDLAGAGKHLQILTRISPDDAETWKTLGLFLSRHDFFKESIAALEKAAVLKPQDTWLAEYLSYLQPEEPFFERYVVSPETFLGQRNSGEAGEKARYLVDQTVVRIFDQGLNSRFTQQVVEIKSRESAKRFRQHMVQFAPTSQRAKIIAARVFKKDGSISEPVSRGTVPVSEPWYRLYYDVEAEILEFGALESGDVIELRYRVDDTARRNAFNDYFGDLTFIESAWPKNLWRYVMVYPDKRNFYFNDKGLTNVKHSRNQIDNLVHESFYMEDIKALRSEIFMPGISSVAKYLHVSTYRSWEELGNWYRGLIRHQMVPDSRIKERVAELTKRMRDPREKTSAIYNWVITSTRYVGLEFGIHGYKPYRAPLVVSRGFGDCKDKASLLVTMLKLAGVEAEFALIRTRDLGHIDESPASLSAFNHAIVYVPSLDLWLDGTAEHHGTSEFPFGDQAASVLRLKSKASEFTMTPVMSPEFNSEKATIKVLLDPDGDARLETTATIHGASAAVLRRELEAERTRRERFESSLVRSYPGARLGDLEVSPLDDLDGSVDYKYSAFVPRLGKIVNKVLEVPIDRGLNLTSRFCRLTNRNHDLVIGHPAQSTKKTVITIPAGHTVSYTPSTAIIESKFGRLAFETRRVDNEIHLSRRFTMASHRVETADYAEFVEFCRQVDDILAARLKIRRTK
jgi:transglutaminase-like putative cysteine protease